MDMARSTRLVMLIKHMYTVWGRKRVKIYNPSQNYFHNEYIYVMGSRTSPSLRSKLLTDPLQGYTKSLVPEMFDV